MESLRLLACSRRRWRQLVVTYLVFTSSTKLRGHSSTHTGSEGFESGPMLWRLKHFTNWASAAWRLLGHAEGSLSHPLFLHYLFHIVCVEFDWKKELHFLEKLQVDVFLLENIYDIRRMTILVLHQFQAIILTFMNMSN